MSTSSAKQERQHGFIGSTLRIVMICVFFAIGVLYLTIGIIGLVNASDVAPKWYFILNIIFGSCLLTSPFFLNNKRKGFALVIQFLMVMVFTLTGITFIVASSCSLGLHWDVPKWYSIVNLVFGCFLLTAPFFLKSK